MPKASSGPGASVGSHGFETDEVTGLDKYTYADRVKERLDDLGVSDTQKPQLSEEHQALFPNIKPGSYFNGRMPVSVKKLSLDQLNSLQWLFLAWFGYLSFQKNLIAVERSEAMRQKEFLWSHVRKQYRFGTDGKKNSDQVMSDIARGDYRFVKANAQYEEVNALYNCMEAALDVADKDLKVISRAVTIEQIKLEKEFHARGFNKNANWSGRETSNADTKAPPKQGRPFRSPATTR